ncbi:MAG: ribonuclease HII [Bacteroidales bacterium]
MLKPFFDGTFVEAGCDEAGRGCMAGPVTAAAVILKPGTSIDGLNDSKKLTERKRNILAEIIRAEAMAWAVAMVSPEEIDNLNILNASIKAMHKALAMLKVPFALILVDGNRFHPYENLKHHCIIKGDGCYQSIAAASILAKTSRDAYMTALHQSFPQYDWINNKGYATQKHIEAIDRYGRCPQHRKSFQLHRQLKLDF